MLIQYIDQLWKCRCHIDTFLVFDPFDTLIQDFLNDHRIFFNVWIILVQIQKQCYKRRLTIRCHQCVDLILYRLHTGS